MEGSLSNDQTTDNETTAPEESEAAPMSSPDPLEAESGSEGPEPGELANHEVSTSEIPVIMGSSPGVPDEPAEPKTPFSPSEDLSDESSSGPELHLTLAFEELKLSVEAVLFAADRPLEVTEIRDIIGSVSLTDIRLALSDLGHDFEGRSVEIVELGRKYQLRTRQSFAPTVSRLFSGKPRTLSKSALETLAIVAYRQPVTRAEVNALRQVDSSQVMASLKDRELIVPAGTRREPGNPVEYRTTGKFLEIFGLGDLSDLPRLRSLQMDLDTQKEVNKALGDLKAGDDRAPVAEDLALHDPSLDANPEDPGRDDWPLASQDLESDSESHSVQSAASEGEDAREERLPDLSENESTGREMSLSDDQHGLLDAQPANLQIESTESSENSVIASPAPDGETAAPESSPIKRRTKPIRIDDSEGLARPVYSRAGASAADEESVDSSEDDEDPLEAEEEFH